jgi:glycosyltransferase involved in cell wall biosynthesis
MSAPRPRLAILAATSGHSGVDRNLRNLVPVFAARGVAVDILHIEGHGPHFEQVPEHVRVIELGTAHVNTSLAAVVRYLRRERPDALLADKDKVNRLALAARALARTPTRVGVRLGIHVSTNLADRGWWERTVQTFSIRHFYPRADTIIVPSDGVADDLAALGRLARERIQVIPNPVVTPQLAALAEQKADHPWFDDADRPVILGLGELSARKDFETLIRAFAIVRRTRPCRLLIAGRGRRQESLRQLADELGVGADIAVPGFVGNPFAYMRQAKLFVNSSRFEGFANVVAEAMAVGVPIVSTDCPSGPRDILGGGRYGALVPVGDAPAMASAIVQMLDQPTPRAVLLGAAERYTVEQSASRYLAALGFSNP